ncbi:Transmembrane domain-containing protein [Spironucleus salmonicida]|uniref:Transmembrane domain-containing protein n=1 Tax=Spironucleus salmonicida TaxID=348837 RepID=A0A9P8LQZ2_9EUKA|nr:Transmembrane domain-containing protein [Spironucleus salmonicida]
MALYDNILQINHHKVQTVKLVGNIQMICIFYVYILSYTHFLIINSCSHLSPQILLNSIYEALNGVIICRIYACFYLCFHASNCSFQCSLEVFSSSINSYIYYYAFSFQYISFYDIRFNLSSSLGSFSTVNLLKNFKQDNAHKNKSLDSNYFRPEC